MNIQMRGKTAEVLLYEDIGGWFGITADAFIREIKKITDVNTINLRINSNGGNVFDGVAIYNYLKSHKARVEVDIDGIAASIASIIALAGDEVRMADNAWYMIHDPWIATGGTAHDLRKAADTLEGVRDTLLDTYMAKAQASREVISDMMTEETWLNAKDAAEYGFVDSVTADLQIAAHVHKDWFKHPPQALVEEPKQPPKHAEVKQILAKQNMTLRRYKL